MLESDDRDEQLGSDEGSEPVDELDTAGEPDATDAGPYGEPDDSAPDPDVDTDLDTDLDIDLDTDVDTEGDTDVDTDDVDTDEVDTSAAEVPYEPIDATPEGPTAPVTGDQTVDEAMQRLARSQAGTFAERIEAGEHAHRSLQSRLGGLGGA